MSSRSASGSGAELPPPALVRALRHLLRPVVRLLMRHHITQPDLAALLKSIYLEVAREELAATGERETASRLSLLTGVHRKDVRRLQAEGAPGFAPPAAVSLGARLVRHWTTTPEYVDRRGRPHALPRLAEAAGTGPSFEALVASVSTDIRPRAVLDEWLRLGVVELDARDRVRLCVEGFVPTRGFDEKAHFFGRNLHDHIAAAAHNLAGEVPPLLERSVYYDHLSSESVAELTDLAEELGMDALRELNRRALALRKRDARAGGGELRMNFGIYFFRGDSDATSTDEAEVDGG